MTVTFSLQLVATFTLVFATLRAFGHSVAKFRMLVLVGGMIPIVSVQRQGGNIRFVCFG